MHGVDITLLAIGGLRVLVWWWGAFLAVRQKRALPTIGFFGAGLVTILFSWTNAGGHVDHFLLQVASFASAPIVALVVMSFWYASNLYQKGQKWRL